MISTLPSGVFGILLMSFSGRVVTRNISPVSQYSDVRVIDEKYVETERVRAENIRMALLHVIYIKIKQNSAAINA